MFIESFDPMRFAQLDPHNLNDEQARIQLIKIILFLGRGTGQTRVLLLN